MKAIIINIEIIIIEMQPSTPLFRLHFTDMLSFFVKLGIVIINIFLWEYNQNYLKGHIIFMILIYN